MAKKIIPYNEVYEKKVVADIKHSKHEDTKEKIILIRQVLIKNETSIVEYVEKMVTTPKIVAINANGAEMRTILK